MACELCIASQILNIPISWRKSEFGARIHWIGWQFEITSGYIALPLVKLEKTAQLHHTDDTIFSYLKEGIGEVGWATELGDSDFSAHAMLASNIIQGPFPCSCKSF